MQERPKILVVDDERFHLNVIIDVLADDYMLVVAKSGAKALTIAASDSPPDLILLDVVMPGMDGHQVCKRLKEDSITRDIPVLFLTVKSDTDNEMKGFELGASDYITKPFSPPIVQARVKTHLKLSQALKALRQQNEILEQSVIERTKEVVHTQDVAIYCLTSLLEARDNETGNHIRRTQTYVKALAEYLKSNPKYSAQLDDNTITLLYKSAPLHDIGKVGVPDVILHKPGPLDDEEWAIMKKHPEYGNQAIKKSEEHFGTNTFLHYAREIAYTHHEKWNGTGYPQGLKGSEIPLSGRLMALADVYDALISKRVYKPAFSHDRAVGVILEGKGTHFDPDIVDAFVELQSEFQDIAYRFSD